MYTQKGQVKLHHFSKNDQFYNTYKMKSHMHVMYIFTFFYTSNSVTKFPVLSNVIYISVNDSAIVYICYCFYYISHLMVIKCNKV